MNTLKIFFVKLYCNILIVADGNSHFMDRVESFFRSLIFFAPVAFVIEVLASWFNSNQEFTAAVLFFIFLNMVIGGVMHYKNPAKKFDWGELLIKTMLILVVVLVTYFVLEIVISFAGDGLIIDGFRASLQIATLLYPGSKILKNVFILSNGQFPPKYIMDKVYKFQEDGDLAQFLNNKK